MKIYYFSMLISLFTSAPLILNAGEKKEVVYEMSEYEKYFIALSPEEQVEEFVTRFTKFYYHSFPNDFLVAFDHFSKVSGLDAMPYLKKTYESMDFIYVGEEKNEVGWYDRDWGELENEAPLHVLYLVSQMAWKSGFEDNRGIILRPKQEDIEWFVSETERKIIKYIDAYNRIDTTIYRAENKIQDLLGHDIPPVYPHFDDKEETRYLYEKYVDGNEDLMGRVGISKSSHFEGYSGLYYN